MADSDLQPNMPGLNGRAPGDNGHVADSTALPQGALARAGASGAPAPVERVKVVKFSHVSKRFVLHTARPKSFQDLLVSLMGKARLARPPAELAPPREFWALKDVNFSIYQGEAVGIIGENGSGKSTTLKLISRILYPNGGSVSVRGKVSALLELGSGFHPDLTGRENIFLNGSLLGMGRKEMEDLYERIVDFAELGQFIEQPIKWYSSGMTMRLGFAVAINVNPDILITDEVLAVGDEAFQRKCLEAIAEIRRSGKTIIFVSHALDAVRALCGRVIWLDHGVVQVDGPAGAVIDKYLEHTNRRHRARLESQYTGEQTAPPLAADTPDNADDVDPADFAANAGSVRRWGTGDVRITGVQFLDKDREAAQVFETGEALTIRLAYHAPRRVEHPVFGLAFYTSTGINLSGPNTRFAEFDIPFIEGDGTLDYTIPVLPLMGGVYDVTVAATNADMTVMFDHQHGWYHFVVQPNPDLPDRFGLLHIPGAWSLASPAVLPPMPVASSE